MMASEFYLQRYSSRWFSWYLYWNQLRQRGAGSHVRSKVLTEKVIVVAVAVELFLQKFAFRALA